MESTPQGMLADEITEIYVDTSYGLMVKFAHGGYRRASDDEKAKMLAALRQAAVQGREALVTDEMVERAYNRYVEAASRMVDCPRCNGHGYHHGFGEGGHDPDWCDMCGGPGVVGACDELSAMREALKAALNGAGEASLRALVQELFDFTTPVNDAEKFIALSSMMAESGWWKRAKTALAQAQEPGEDK